ncbi:secretion protein [Vibrio anguillarum]|uniref:PAS factor family protein n=1 Tax=Vibrio anguillarum TaxID=55601 RepID=UPI00188B23A5|nr:PAS factor family protein [Vibrio anguillarum]MBF4258875.1 secretion protein [Vibrio anguillarum]MBF4278770.1 secretion protein [Vibrio anguillarum]MBF4300856.1 secretion protein [Vibrio anguillarum]MBF4364583.1 secretion protein [Vibrio anguillarum]MBF4398980.1 secretion protein [Vibrio anguillarum]
MKALIYETLISLANQDPEQHAKIRENLYEQLGLPLDKQLALYSRALGPASSGKLENDQALNNAVESAIKLLETPEH